MTVITAATGPDGTFIAADGLTTVGSQVTLRNATKWNVSPSGAWAFAGAGEVQYDSVILQDADYPWPDADVTAERGVHVMASRFRELFDSTKGAQMVRDNDCIFGDYRYAPLVATEGHVWRICSDLLTVDPPLEDRFQACGQGYDLAAGAMSALLSVMGPDVSGRTLALEGVRAACRNSIYCGGEIFVQQLGGGEPQPGAPRDGGE